MRIWIVSLIVVLGISASYGDTRNQSSVLTERQSLSETQSQSTMETKSHFTNNLAEVIVKFNQNEFPLQEHLKNLQSDNPQERADSAYALGIYALQSGFESILLAKPILENLLNDEDRDVRKFSKWTLNMIKKGEGAVEEQEKKEETKEKHLKKLKDIKLVLDKMEGDPNFDLSFKKLLSIDIIERIEAIKVLALWNQPEATHLLLLFLKENNLAIQKTALQALKDRTKKVWEEKLDSSVVEPLISLLNHEDYAIREMVVVLLGYCQDAHAVEPLLRASIVERNNNYSYRIILKIKDALRKMGEVTFKRYIELLHHDDPEIRKLSIAYLGSSQDSRAVEALTPLLENPDQKIKKASQRALENLQSKINSFGDLKIKHEQDPRAVEIVMGKMENSNKQGRKKAIRELSMIKIPSAIDALVKCLKYEETRGNVFHQLRKSKMPEARAALIKLLESEDYSILKKAAFALGMERDEAARDTLIELLQQDEDKEVRRSAANYLGYVGGQESVPSLVYALKNDTDEIKYVALESLSSIHDYHAHKVLLGYLNSADQYYKVKALQALRTVDDPRIVDYLIDFLVKTDSKTRVKILGVLKKLTNKNFQMDITKWKTWWMENKDEYIKKYDEKKIEQQ